MTRMVIDLSHHNVIPASLKPTKAAGIHGLLHKVTESTTFTDPKVRARYQLAKDAGMLWGIYHFIRPGSVEMQAKYFIQTAARLDVLHQRTLLALDHEDPKVSLDDALLFLQIVQRETNSNPIIYSGHVLKEQMQNFSNHPITAYRLWLAQYSSTPTLPKGWTKYFLWQYTDKGEVAGVTPPTDLNHFIGSPQELEAEWVGEQQQPTPVPPAQDKVVRVIAPEGVEVIVERS